jgi:ribosomal protein S1
VQVRILEIDPEARRMSLSIRRAAETAPPATAAPCRARRPHRRPAASKKAKRKGPLKGGLDWNW